MTGEKILIVDDDFAHALLCQRLLEHVGYTARAVNNTQDTMVELRSTPYDLLISDIRMPDMDGFELMTIARQSNPDLSILLMTGFGTVENAVQALRYGADGLLLKPLNSVDELVKTVGSLLLLRQNRMDAVRLKVLHPLFNMSERLFSETTPELLNDLIVNDIRTQMKSTVTGVYVSNGDQINWQILAGDNLILPDPDSQRRANRALSEISIEGHHVLIPRSDERVAALQDWMIENRYRDIVVVPVKRAHKCFIFYAIRSENQPEWTNPDLELIVIYGRQAAVALENAQLYFELTQFIQQLEESQRSLIMAEKMAALGRLMASLAHELNNPLQSVQNCLHLAAREDLPEPQRQEFIELAVQQVQRVSSLAQTAMEYYRPKRLVKQKVDLLGLIESVLVLVAPQLATHNITVNRSFPDHPVEITIIRDNLQQVILNLLLNAMDALLESTRDRVIWIDINELETEVEITIEDNGNGLPAEVEARLFEPFVSTKSDGTGLGLSISYELIVDVHGGELGFVPPAHGSGARVRITLPWKD